MKTPSIAVLVLAAMLSGPCSTARAAEAPWLAGVASVKITPAEPVLMYGFSGRNKPHQGVAGDLFAKALALQDPAGARAVLVTCDLGGVHGDMTARIAARLHAKHQLPRSALLINASHTHAGPLAWAGDEPALAASPAWKATTDYIAWLERQVEEVALRALARLEPAALSWGLGVAPFVMNRREFTDKGVVLGVNPKGPVDRSVLVLRVDDPDAKLRAVVMGAACHCTCTGSKNFQIDGDYAGHAQAEVEARFPGAQAMFLAGCGGDANPWPRGELDHARQHGATLAAEVARVLATKLAPVRPPLRAASRVADLPVAPPAPRAELEAMAKSSFGWQRYIGARQLALLDAGRAPATSFPMPVALWQFGGDLTLAALGGEPVGDYVPLIEGAIGPLRLWVAGYCGDVFGYVPTARILREGGYETRGIDRGDAVGQFTPEAERRILDAILGLARETGRLK